MPLIKDGSFVTDPWIRLADEDALPEIGPIIVSLTRWVAARDALLARGWPLGICLASGESVEAITGDLDRFEVVALEFPTFMDGRSYSAARLLRERHGFSGELRAVGNVLRDQFLFLHRCGFDAFEVREGETVSGWLQAVAALTVWYQPTGDARVTVPQLRPLAPIAAD